MPFVIDESEERWRLAGQGDWRLAEVEALGAALRQGLSSGKPIEIDVSALQAVDLAAFQLLCGLHQEARRRGRSVRRTTPVPAAIREGLLGAGGPAFCCNARAGADDQCIWLGD
jgi:ABC-type transporter Mla MlaB component